MQDKIVPLHPAAQILRNRRQSLVNFLENDCEELELASTIRPERIGVLEQSAFGDYTSFMLKTQKEDKDLGTAFGESGVDFVRDQLMAYVESQGYEPQLLLQMEEFPAELPLPNPQRSPHAIYVVNGNWLESQEFARYINHSNYE